MNFIYFITSLNKIKFGNLSNDTASLFATPVMNMVDETCV